MGMQIVVVKYVSFFIVLQLLGLFFFGCYDENGLSYDHVMNWYCFEFTHLAPIFLVSFLVVGIVFCLSYGNLRCMAYSKIFFICLIRRLVFGSFSRKVSSANDVRTWFVKVRRCL